MRKSISAVDMEWLANRADNLLLAHLTPHFPIPTTALTIGMAKQAIKSLAKHYAGVSITSYSVAQAKTKLASVANHSVDLFMANLLVEPKADLENLFAAVERILSEEGVFLFTTNDSRTKALLAKYAQAVMPDWVDENSSTEQLEKFDLFQFFFRRYHVLLVGAVQEYVDCDVFIAASAYPPKLLKQLLEYPIRIDEFVLQDKPIFPAYAEDALEQKDRDEVVENDVAEEGELDENAVSEEELLEVDEQDENMNEKQDDIEFEKEFSTEEVAELHEENHAEPAEVEKEDRVEALEAEHEESKQDEIALTDRESVELAEKEALNDELDEIVEEESEPAEIELKENENESELESDEEVEELDDAEEFEEAQETDEPEEVVLEAVNEQHEQVAEETPEKLASSEYKELSALSEQLHENEKNLQEHEQVMSRELNNTVRLISKARLVHAGNLDAKKKQTEQLTTHQKKLTDYRQLMDKHKALLGDFIEAHERFLRKYTTAPAKFTQFIDRQNNLFKRHHDNIAQHEAFLNTKS